MPTKKDLPQVQIVTNKVFLSPRITYNELIKTIQGSDHVEFKNDEEKAEKLNSFMPSVFIPNGYRASENTENYTGVYGFDFDVDLKLSNINKFNLSEIEQKNIDKDLNYIKAILDETGICFWINRSVSNCGFRLLVRTDMIPDSSNQVDNQVLYKHNYTRIINLLKSIIKEHPNKNHHYHYKFDNTSDPARMFYFNKNLAPYNHIEFVPENILTEKKLIEFENRYEIEVFNNHQNFSLGFDAEKTNEKYLKELKIIKDDPVRRKQLEDYCSQVNLHHGEAENLFMINKLNRFGRTFFYQVYRKYYKGTTDSQYLKNFSLWNNYIDGFKQQENRKNRTLRAFFEDSGIRGLDVNYYNSKPGHDFYGYQCDIELQTDKYVSDIYNEVKKSLIEGINILKAPAGSGKSTFFERLVKDFIGRNILVVSVKKVLLEQQFNHYVQSGLDKTFTLHKNYGGIYPNVKNDKNNIIFSTINSLPRILSQLKIDLLLFDECHLLVDYSNLEDKFESKYISIYKFLSKDITQIYTSATPEKFVNSLFGLNYNYINVNVSGYKKTDINIVYSGKSKSRDNLFSLITTTNSGITNNLIYVNDKEEGKRIAEKLENEPFNLKTVQLNRDTQKEDEMVQIINSELLETGITYVSTSYISEGINFMNDEKFNVYCIDNYTTDIANVYQLTNRFRKRIIQSYYFTAPPREYKLVKTGKDNKRKREYYTNYELYDFKGKFELRYSETKALQSILSGKSTIKNILNSQLFVDDGNIVNRFYLSFLEDREAMEYIKTNKDYYYSLLRYYFNVTDVSKPDEKTTVPVYKALDKEEIKFIYKKYGEILDLIFSENLNLNIDSDVDYLNRFYRFTGDEFEKLKRYIHHFDKPLRRISNQNKQLQGIKKDYEKFGVVFNSSEDLIFESSIKFRNELFKLKALLVINAKSIMLGSEDKKQKEEFNESVGWIQNNLVDGFIISSDLQDYLNKNAFVKGALWTNLISEHLNLKSATKKISGKNVRVLKLSTAKK